MTLRPFIRYYGGKWRAAPLYPAPLYRTIVEPFAGAAGYSLRHHRHDVVLVEKYPPLAEMWRWLIAAAPADVLRIPVVDHVDELPDWVRDGARVLVRMSFANGDCRLRNHTSKAILKCREERCVQDTMWGWTSRGRGRVASQVLAIKHWRVIEGDYTLAPDLGATWFVDPPYSNRAGLHYPCGCDEIDFGELGQWCRERRGQVIACENEGATWLPFRPFAQMRRGLNKSEGSREAIWTNGPMGQGDLWEREGA